MLSIIFTALESDIEALPTSPFTEIDRRLATLLHERFAMNEFRRGQLDILRSVAQGRDTMAVMPTGGGKSLCYQLPSLLKDGITVVISPLIALMRDQVAGLKRLGIAAGALHSGQPDDEKREVFRELGTSPHFLLYVSPERTQHEGFTRWVAHQKINLFAIDEAHCLSQWGPDFRTDYHKLSSLRQLRPDVPILALTATATPPVLRDIEQRLALREPSRHVYGFHRPNLYLQIEHCEEKEKLAWVIEAVRSQVGEGRALIYCGTRKQAHEIATQLKSDFDKVGYYHAGLSPESRSRIQQDFESGKLRILAATNAFGMGIDRPDVRLVVHYQMPANIEGYYQEIGRAGRDGLASTCLLLYARKDKGLHAYFIQKSDASEGDVRTRWRALDTFVQFLESEECRFAGILTYFRDTTRLKTCGHCDVCLLSSPHRVATPAIRIAAPKTRLRKKLGAKADDGEPLDGLAQIRFDSLREWRKTYADANDVAAFIVFSNKTLRDLALKHPKTREELANVYGFGEKKVEHLGGPLLEALRAL